MKPSILIFTCCFFMLGLNAQMREQEASVKAAFIYNFTKYIEWDSTDTRSDFVIGIIGSTPVTELLKQIAQTSTVNGKRIVVRVFNKPDEIMFCHMLFIAKNNSFSLESILERVERGVLTISEENGYARQGTGFNFVVINNKLKFEANLKVLYSQGIRAGSQLLKLAIIVD